MMKSITWPGLQVGLCWDHSESGSRGACEEMTKECDAGWVLFLTGLWPRLFPVPFMLSRCYGVFAVQVVKTSVTICAERLKKMCVCVCVHICMLAERAAHHHLPTATYRPAEYVQRRQCCWRSRCCCKPPPGSRTWHRESGLSPRRNALSRLSQWSAVKKGGTIV